MNTQDELILTADDDTEGHLCRGVDEDQAEDTEGHLCRSAEGDEDEDDTVGHKYR
jgi:hypothetical protein